MSRGAQDGQPQTPSKLATDEPAPSSLTISIPPTPSSKAEKKEELFDEKIIGHLVEAQGFQKRLANLGLTELENEAFQLYRTFLPSTDGSSKKIDVKSTVTQIQEHCKKLGVKGDLSQLRLKSGINNIRRSLLLLLPILAEGHKDKVTATRLIQFSTEFMLTLHYYGLVINNLTRSFPDNDLSKSIPLSWFPKPSEDQKDILSPLKSPTRGFRSQGQ